MQDTVQEETTEQKQPEQQVVDCNITAQDVRRLIDIAINHKNAKSFIRELENGTNLWFFELISNYAASRDQQREACLTLSEKVMEHLNTRFALERQYSVTRKAFADYFQTDPKIGAAGMSFIINTLYTMEGDNFSNIAALIIALVITLNRDEQQFETLRKQLPDPVDVRGALFLFYNLKRQKKL